jgi:hypothetical protein
MSNADRLPLLLFQEPVPTPKARGFGGGSKFNPRDRDEVAGYLGPKLSRLEQSLEAERIRVQATGAGIEPEMALVIELATGLDNFVSAARGIGLEWLAEDEIDLDPIETIFLRLSTSCVEPSAGLLRRRAAAMLKSSPSYCRPPCATYWTPRTTMSSSAYSPTHRCCSRP